MMFKDTLGKKIIELFGNAKVLAVENLWGDDFVVLLAPEQKPDLTTLQDITIASRIGIRESLKQELLKITGGPLEIHAGYAVLSLKSENLESRLYNAVREAQGIAKGSIDLQTARLLPEFRGLLDSSRFNVVYQPIVSLRSGNVLGWEALTRGPRDSYFRSPDIIFSFAEEVGLLFPLEKVCRHIAVTRLGELGSEQKLFLNIHPRTINDPNFVQGETLKLIKEVGLKPRNIVFEITERHNINDFSCFNKTLEYYRNQGFLVAVDDAGSGFSCLQSIAEIRPDFIKIDMSLIRDIHVNPVKRALLETFVTFAKKIGCSIIAEGIEEEDELTTIAGMGAHYGQGYLLGRPVYPKSHLSNEVSQKISHLSSTGRNRVWKHGFPVGDIIENAVSVDKNTPVREVKTILDKNEQDLLRYSSEGLPFSVIYIDLDNFKVYNDKYGFESGDRVILFTSSLLNSVLRKYGGEKDFLGHIGGDDFIIITGRECADTLCKRIIKYFDRLIKSFYEPADRKEGKIFGYNREGRKNWFPLISISIAVIECGVSEMADLRAISEKAAQLKRYAKSIPGSVYVRERRTVKI